MPFCTDIDLLSYEPAIGSVAAIASQTLIRGTADLSGSTLTIASGSLVSSHVTADMIVALDGSVAGCFAIVSVDSATTMTISPLHEDLPTALPVGSAAGLTFAVRTFWPQRQIVSEMLLAASGVESADSIVNAQSLRRCAILGTLHMIYSAMESVDPSEASHSVSRERYARAFRSAMRSVTVEIDLNDDGRVDCTRKLSVVELARR